MMTEIEAMWDLFRRAAEQPVKQLFFADVRPLPPQSEFVHQHPCPRLLIQLAGSTRIHHARGGQLSTKILQPGTVLFAHPGAWAEERPDSDTVLFSMVLLDECVRFIRRVGQEKHVYHTAAIRCRALPRIMEAILAIDQDTPLCRHLLTPLFEALSEEFNAEMREERLSRREQEWKLLQEFITLNLARDIGRNEIATAAGLQPATVSRRIRSHSGMTLRRYLTVARLNYARRLLMETDLSIEEIARQSGYRYASYFIRAYRKVFGTSPGADRAGQETNTGGHRTRSKQVPAYSF